MTQNKALLKHLLSGRKITQQQANIEYGIGRLASRVYDLVQMGVDIKTKNAPVLKHNGETTWVAQYYIPIGESNKRNWKIYQRMK